MIRPDITPEEYSAFVEAMIDASNHTHTGSPVSSVQSSQSKEIVELKSEPPSIEAQGHKWSIGVKQKMMAKSLVIGGLTLGTLLAPQSVMLTFPLIGLGISSLSKDIKSLNAAKKINDQAQNLFSASRSSTRLSE